MLSKKINIANDMKLLTMTKLIFNVLLGISTVCLSLFLLSNLAYSQLQDITTISTRDHFDNITGDIISNESLYVFLNTNDEIMNCPPELVVYVHGVWVGKNSLETPNEIFDRLKLSLQENGYQFPLIGYSWDSDSDISPQGWNTAKHIASQNGESLGIFLIDYKQQCPQTDMRVIAHSLGARVVLEALNFIDNNSIWNNKGFVIPSVHLLGAAVDNEEVSIDLSDGDDDNLFSFTTDYDPSVKSIYGHVIENQVSNFYNLYNENDNALEVRTTNAYYPFFEKDFALGNNGIDGFSDPPHNYTEYSVKDEINNISDADADGNCDLQAQEWVPNLFGFGSWENVCTIREVGDNHFGYIGFREDESHVFDDGAIDRIVNDWTSS